MSTWKLTRNTHQYEAAAMLEFLFYGKISFAELVPGGGGIDNDVLTFVPMLCVIVLSVWPDVGKNT